jgi:hypothetical protein
MAGKLQVDANGIGFDQYLSWGVLPEDFWITAISFSQKIVISLSGKKRR